MHLFEMNAVAMSDVISLFLRTFISILLEIVIDSTSNKICSAF